MKIDRLYQELGKAIENAPSIPPCMVSDPEAWFANQAQSASRETQNAKRLCGTCPVQAECLAYALANPELQGIWGGATPRERTRLRMKQRT
jgi:WhiB family transcriptional regulator, redox-sensing transcriptional regulator